MNNLLFRKSYIFYIVIITFTGQIFPILSSSRPRFVVRYLQITQLFKSIFLIAAILLSAQSGHSQEIQETKITGSFSGSSLQQFFGSLEKTYGIRFYYKEEWVKSVEVTTTFKEMPLIQVLNQAFQGKELNFKFFQQNSVVVYPKNVEENSTFGEDKSKVLVIGDPLNQGRYQRAKLRGKVLEGKTGEPLAGAIVYNPETKVGVATDSKLRYMRLEKNLEPMWSLQR